LTFGNRPLHLGPRRSRHFKLGWPTTKIGHRRGPDLAKTGHSGYSETSTTAREIVFRFFTISNRLEQVLDPGAFQICQICFRMTNTILAQFSRFWTPWRKFGRFSKHITLTLTLLGSFHFHCILFTPEQNSDTDWGPVDQFGRTPTLQLFLPQPSPPLTPCKASTLDALPPLRLLRPLEGLTGDSRAEETV
jgi:hypothetical protein